MRTSSPGPFLFERHRTVLATKAIAVLQSPASVDKGTGTVNENLSRMVKSSVLSKFPEIQFIEPIGLMPGKFFSRKYFRWKS